MFDEKNESRITIEDLPAAAGAKELTAEEAKEVKGGIQTIGTAPHTEANAKGTTNTVLTFER